MTALQRTLVQFFAAIGLPVYLAEWVPAGARLPYLTLSVERADAFGRGSVTVRCWHSAGNGGNAARAAVMDALAAAVPPGGLCLTGPEGATVLRRAASGFQRLTAGPGGGGPAGGETVFELRCYGG